MNLQQLNQSGQQIWVFLITAAISLAVTALSWFLVEQSNSYLTWLRQENAEWQDRPRYTITVRIALILWLIHNGHTSWARSSGAWWAILTNDGSPCRVLSHRSDDNDANSREAAGAYVSRYRHAPPSISSVAFREGLVTWKQVRTFAFRRNVVSSRSRFERGVSMEGSDNA